MSEIWVENGHFLDLKAIEQKLKPSKERFHFVEKRNLTGIKGITQDISAGDTAEVDFAKDPIKDVLKPRSDMVYQCAWGFYPDNKAYVVHPVDVESDKIVKERPSENWRVGIVRMFDSPYLQPSIQSTEFWVLDTEGSYVPKLEFKEVYDRDATMYVNVQINMLKVSPITDSELIDMLEKRRKPSTPVYLQPMEW